MREKAENILNWIEANRERCIGFLQDLVRIPSENKPPHGDELECQRLVERTFSGIGMETEMFRPDEVEGILTHPGYLHGRDYTNRPNVVGLTRGKIGAKRIMLTAHIDVVPAGDPALWTDEDPWSGRIEDGKLNGRGSSDDKSGVAAMTMVATALKECGVQLNSDLVLASVVDEESGGANGAVSSVLQYPCDYYLNLDGFYDCYTPVSVSGGRFRIEFETRISPTCSRTVLDAMHIMYDEMRVLEALKLKEFDKPFFRENTADLPVYRVIEVRAGSEDDSTASNHGHINAYVYSTEDKETNRRQIEEIIDRAYAKMDQEKIKRPTLKFLRRFFVGATSAPDNPLLRSALKNHERVTGRKPIVGCAPISDQALISQYGGGITLGIGCSFHDGEPGQYHHPNEAVDIEKYIEHIKIIALTVLDIDEAAE